GRPHSQTLERQATGRPRISERGRNFPTNKTKRDWFQNDRTSATTLATIWFHRRKKVSPRRYRCRQSPRYRPLVLSNDKIGRRVRAALWRSLREDVHWPSMHFPIESRIPRRRDDTRALAPDSHRLRRIAPKSHDPTMPRPHGVER